jgi:arginine deiminase
MDTDVSAVAQRGDSEVGRLRTVLVHRAGPGLRAVTAGNAARMLFAGPVVLAQAQAEHDELVAELRARDVEVLFVDRCSANSSSKTHVDEQQCLSSSPRHAFARPATAGPTAGFAGRALTDR